MSKEESAGHDCASINVYSMHDQSDSTIISYLQHRLAAMDQCILKLSGRLCHLERKLENENNSIFPAQYQTDALLRSEATSIVKKSGSDSLSLLSLQLNNLNLRMRELEDCCRHNLRISVKTELDTIIEDSVRRVIENNYQLLLDNASGKTRSTSHYQDNGRSSEFNAPMRDISSGVSHEINAKNLKRQPDAITPEKSVCLEQKNSRTHRSEPTSDVTLQGNTRETKVCAVGPFRETTDDDQPRCVDSTVQDETGKNVARGIIEPPFSTKRLSQQKSIDAKIEDEYVNASREAKQARPISIRTLNQQFSLEGRLELDESDNSKELLSEATGTSIRTLNQQVSLEGKVEVDERSIKKEMLPAISTRTLYQQISIEGKLEEDANKNTATELQSTISTTNAKKTLFLEPGKRQGDKSSTLGKMPKTDSRPKSGRMFRKKSP